MNELEDFKDTIGYIISRLWDNAMIAKEDVKNAETKEDRQYDAGRLEAYWEIFDTISNELEIQEINPEEIDFDYDLNELHVKETDA